MDELVALVQKKAGLSKEQATQAVDTRCGGSPRQGHGCAVRHAWQERKVSAVSDVVLIWSD